MSNIRFPFGVIGSYGEVRRRATTIARGPKWLGLEKLEGELFNAWQVLLLDVRPGRPDRIESRSVYANLNDDLQQFAILRSIQWDGAKTRNLLKEQGDEFILTLPARFVTIPLMQVKSWLNEFKGVKTFVNERHTFENDQKILRVKVDQHWSWGNFEKVWQVQNINEDELGQKHNKIWFDMSEALKKETSVYNFGEEFDFDMGKFKYNNESFGFDMGKFKYNTDLYNRDFMTDI